MRSAHRCASQQALLAPHTGTTTSHVPQSPEHSHSQDSLTRPSLAPQEQYADLPLDVALRVLLREFKLPGEAQQIDRIMEKFADRFCRANPGAFVHADDAYKLAFATIMLNTDIHNPMAEHMLTPEIFVDMNTDTGDDGVPRTALPLDELQGIFDRISKEVRTAVLPLEHLVLGGGAIAAEGALA